MEEAAKTQNQEESLKRSERRQFFVAVHVGAGYHSPKNEAAYKRVMRRSCLAAASILSQEHGQSLDAVVAAIKVLEDDEYTNAGRGSNLTEGGHIECDASIMEGLTGSFGAVGALSGVKNPIEVAAVLAKETMVDTYQLGRIPPMFLVGNGAQEWAQSKGISVATADKDTDLLITERTKRQWLRYKRMLDAADQSGPPSDEKRCRMSESQDRNSTRSESFNGPFNEIEEDDQILDTVGAICIDSSGNIASGASSGGIAMKVKGRIGLAAMHGCGCWASFKELDDSCSAVGACATGAGERIIKGFVSRECCLYALQSASGPVKACLDVLESIVGNCRQFGMHDDAGSLLLQACNSKGEKNFGKIQTVELVAAYTSLSFGIGYFGSCMTTPKVSILRQPEMPKGRKRSVQFFASSFNMRS